LFLFCCVLSLLQRKVEVIEERFKKHSGKLIQALLLVLAAGNQQGCVVQTPSARSRSSNGWIQSEFETKTELRPRPQK